MPKVLVLENNQHPIDMSRIQEDHRKAITVLDWNKGCDDFLKVIPAYDFVYVFTQVSEEDIPVIVSNVPHGTSVNIWSPGRCISM